MAGAPEATRTYPVARVLDVHDGDTLRVLIDLGFGVLTRQWIRLQNVRAPELREPTGLDAKNQVFLWLGKYAAPDWYVTVTTIQTAGDFKEIRERRTFIRYVGMIESVGSPGEEVASLNGYLRAQGYTDQGM
jgi:hypothetical protein